ncbi:acyl-CoA Delta-9 desaturase-like [Leptopilina heterotoma]|uniref:acyl-CoA Delta-9 desaturase-like n=1 Tax=Leptopilina heterotoma TaxID=63436 RepID=UPI001CA7CA9B|nr:acyl-CoA Delta-9 desaturase-like [Leptopilina heterotoma]XP_043471855.1 acyl-CoA Delta-9 desaturase-like [Leptopilina heterotoma]XP_043471856.1 acyl-CoA Delta-9 desaturase-like [Leptopilina heterotoma]XP_043471857.1 acyl-CoA Delta-9 desaturase-like [Leptopilina heterotoma]
MVPKAEISVNNDSTTVYHKETKKSSSYFKTEVKWLTAFFVLVLHIAGVYFSFTFPYLQKKKTVLFEWIVAHMVGFGVTGGVHRFWTHRAYKAKWPLRLILLVCFYTSGQNSLYNWVRYHRLHHKYTETDADPHNSNRGFFFSHVGWLMMRRHPEVIRRGKQIDMSDILQDPIVAFGEKYFEYFKVLFTFVIPIVIPVYLWNEEWYYSIATTIVRYIVTLNSTWSVNSLAHMWGAKPYDKTIAPVENKLVAHMTMGEGWHNYHHVFPYDYKCAELGNYSLNWTTFLIDMFAKIGWAYDLKQPREDLIKTVKEKRGQDSHIVYETPN